MARRYAPQSKRDLFRDTFTVPKAAPLGSPLTADVGEWVVNDTANHLSISGGNLVADGGESAWGNPGMWGSALARVAGRALIVDITPADTNKQFQVGWDANQVDYPPGGNFYFVSTGELRCYPTYGGGSLKLGTYSATNYKAMIALRSAGQFWLINDGSWKLLYVGSSDTVSPLYPAISNYNAAFTASQSHVVDLPGAWGNDFGIARFHVTAPAAVSPSLGAEMWDAAASTFEAGTYSWAAYAGSVISNDANTLRCAYNIPGLSGMYLYLSDAADLNSNLTIGQFYSFSTDEKVDVGSTISLKINTSVQPVEIILSDIGFTRKTMTFIATATTNDYINAYGIGVGEALNIDNLSLAPISHASLLANVQDIASDGHYITAWPTAPTDGNRVGVAMCIDDETNPQNFVLASHDGTNCYLSKWVGGVWTNLISAAAAWSNNARLYLRRIPGTNTFDLYYNEALIGTPQTIADAGVISNTKVATFSTDAALVPSYFDGWPGTVTIPERYIR